MLHVLHTSFSVDVCNVCLVSKKRYSIYLLPFVLFEFNIVAVPFSGCDHLSDNHCFSRLDCLEMAVGKGLLMLCPVKVFDPVN